MKKKKNYLDKSIYKSFDGKDYFNMTLLALVVFFAWNYNAGAAQLDHKTIVKSMNEAYSEDDKSFDFDENLMNRENNLVPMEVFVIKKLGKKVIPQPKKKKLLMKSSARNGVDYRYRDTPIKNQWNGTCTAFSGVAGIENLLNDPKSLDLSERDAWSKYKQYSNEAFVDSMIGEKICNESDWPQHRAWKYKSCAKNRKHGLISAEYIDNDIDMALDALNSGSVVYLGMSTPRDMVNCYSVIRTGSRFAKGGHAILIVGYQMDNSIKGGGYFIIKNSWGSNCGDNGYQYLPFYMCQKRGGYCVMWEFSKDKKEISKIKYKEVEKCVWKRVWWKPWRFREVCWTEEVEVK